MAQYRVITMLEKTFEAQKERALLTLELLTINPRRYRRSLNK